MWSDSGGGLYSVAVDGAAPLPWCGQRRAGRCPVPFRPMASGCCTHRTTKTARRAHWSRHSTRTAWPASRGRCVPDPPADLRRARFSGRQVGRIRVESVLGTREAYVMPFHGPGGVTPVAAGPSREPRWSRDGRELFFWDSTARTALWSVRVSTSPSLSLGEPIKSAVAQVGGNHVGRRSRRQVSRRTPAHVWRLAHLDAGHRHELVRRVRPPGAARNWQVTKNGHWRAMNTALYRGQGSRDC